MGRAVAFCLGFRVLSGTYRLDAHFCTCCWRTRLTSCPLLQGFFYSCHRIKLSLKASSAVHPLATAAAAAEAEEGMHEASALKGRPRALAARASALEVLTQQAPDANAGAF